MKLTEASQKSWAGLTTILKNVQTWDFYRSIKFSYLYHKVKLKHVLAGYPGKSDDGLNMVL